MIMCSYFIECFYLIICFICFQWDGGAIVQMGWSVSEDLLCVADDGSVLVYDIHGAIKKTLTMGQVSDQHHYNQHHHHHHHLFEPVHPIGCDIPLPFQPVSGYHLKTLFQSFHPACCLSASTVLIQVFLGHETALLLSGLHSNTTIQPMDLSLHSVCPIQFQRHLLISSLILLICFISVDQYHHRHYHHQSV